MKAATRALLWLAVFCALQARAAARPALSAEACHASCLTCAAFLDCTSCRDGFYLQAARCQPCPKHCAACSSAGSCERCVEGYKPGLLSACTEGLGRADLQKFLPYVLVLLVVLFSAACLSLRKRKPAGGQFRRRTRQPRDVPQSAGLEDCYGSFAAHEPALEPGRPARRYSEDDARRRTGSFHQPTEQTLQTPHFIHALAAHVAPEPQPPGVAAGKPPEAGGRDEQTYTESMSTDFHPGEERPATSFRHPLFEDRSAQLPHSPLKSIVI